MTDERQFVSDHPGRGILRGAKHRESRGETVVEKLLSPREAAEYVEREWGLRLAPETIRRWVRVKALPAATTHAGRMLISTVDLHVAFEAKAATVDND